VTHKILQMYLPMFSCGTRTASIIQTEYSLKKTFFSTNKMAADKDVSERFSSRVWHFYQWILFVKNSTWLGRL